MAEATSAGATCPACKERIAWPASPSFPLCGRCASDRAEEAEVQVSVRVVRAGERVALQVNGGFARKTADVDGIRVQRGGEVIFVPRALLVGAGLQVLFPRRRARK